MLKLFLFAALTSVAAAQHAAPAAVQKPPREAQQFDFLIGQWELVVTPEAKGLAAKIHGVPKLAGTWKAWRALDGWGIEDELRIVDRSANPMAFTAFTRLYDATSKQWRISGAEAYRGAITVAAAQIVNGDITTTSNKTDDEGKAFMGRTRFRNITANSFRYEQDRSYDGGKTWEKPTLTIDAKRTAALAPR